MSSSYRNITLYDSSYHTNFKFTIDIDYYKDITVGEIKQKFIDKLLDAYNEDIKDINSVRLVIAGKIFKDNDIGIYSYDMLQDKLHVRIYYKL
jgi:hypothetical protein